jgi:mono/diheme cytochrome c family protein
MAAIEQAPLSIERSPLMKKMLLGILVALVAVVGLIALVIGGGLYNVAADEEHAGLVYELLETARERSIATRASGIAVPDLSDSERIRRGAGNYDSMCASCHLAPGARPTELSLGLYPQPPDLSKAGNFDPARVFWVIKHGIRATGMPAWGKSMEDAYIWDMVAFARKLPDMKPEEYSRAVRESEGHSHGGGEGTDKHDDGPDTDQHHRAEGTDDDHGEHRHDSSTDKGHSHAH